VEVLVWGESVDHEPVAAAYAPETGLWRPIGAAPLPVADRWAAVWTGADVFAFAYPDDSDRIHGAVYSVQSDSWRELPDSPVSPLFASDAIWTGTEVLVLSPWTERLGPRLLPSGAYDPALGSWTAAALPPSNATAEPLTWTDGFAIFTGLGEALGYQPEADRWVRVPPPPSVREWSTAVWTGSELVVWGGSEGQDFPSEALVFRLAPGSP
jgi:hypothetical protein